MLTKLLLRLLSNKITKTLHSLQLSPILILEQRIIKLEKQLKDVQEIALETVDMTGGEGWVNVVQNAIMQLDQELDHHNLVLNKHQQIFNTIVQDQEQIVDIVPKPKNDLN